MALAPTPTVYVQSMVNEIGPPALPCRAKVVGRLGVPWIVNSFVAVLAEIIRPSTVVENGDSFAVAPGIGEVNAIVRS
ncbi:MAG: hypothetical protein K2R98_11235 [Gemmataceae bacterium]|nr:hypothetical protein [Gemmataceae bacterium]